MSERESGTKRKLLCGERAWASASGVLIGLGVIYPLAGVAGLVTGLAGGVFVHGGDKLERDRQARLARESKMQLKRSLDEKILDLFEEEGVVRGSIDEG